MTTVEFKLGGTLKFLVEPEARAGARITISYDGLTLTAWGDAMAYTLPNDKKIAIKVAYVDAHGNPAQVDGEVTWDTSDTAIATVAADPIDPNGMQAVVTPAGQVGQVQVTATADADLGQGTREIITTMDVDIVAGEAVAGTITPVGEPAPINPTPKA